MVIYGTWNNRPITLSIKPNCLTVSVEWPTGAQVASFDYAGRLWTSLQEGVSYRRGLNGKIVAKWQTGSGSRERRWLGPQESLGIEAAARSLLGGLLVSLESGEARLDTPLPSQGLDGIQRALAFDQQRSQADAHRYHQVYKPVGILPPDQYMAVVLQATEGCSFNTCTFCTFYRDRPFRIKRPEEFEEHARAVREFIGAGLSLRRTIFLGDANALVTPMKQLLPLLEVTHRIYDVERLGGIYAFLDGFSGEKKSAADFRALGERGLKRVYIGLESGNDRLLNFLRKPGSAGNALRTVQAIKGGDVAVGIIVLLGAGGQAYASEHVSDTVRLLNAMDLDADDLIYFSELVESEGLEYSRQAYQADLLPLSPEGRAAQGEAIESGLVFHPRRGVPHISRYDIREFVY